ncbi:3-oxoacyl-[acyl-carrier-protein] synthase III C-terminal domain-containing protein [Micromonospora sp. KC723]|uniref:3-oxoacyl-[acyl-carrier-protein] synthase III C-terminal domain-containing protein n=1 Tax=Micromonospora sp. KC723 TaxID=2530381 RepID=UPI001FB64178|nr:3-oxoacyl-[acyl-carrier-protein] synthase III C-terminal domain-containing protein [Micromonospora sp. KC723]
MLRLRPAQDRVPVPKPLDISSDQTTWDWGSTIGHLGAGDQIAGLAHLRRTGRLGAGQLCALVGAGGGFSWSVAVLEVSEEASASSE